MNKAIVTGATGFIGRFLVRELLERQYEVIAVVRKNTRNILFLPSVYETIECDLKDFGHLDEYVLDRDIDVVFHTAWQGISDDDSKNEDIQLANVENTLKLIDSSYRMGVGTFVGCGSIHEAEAYVEMAQGKVVTNLGIYYKSAKVAAHWMGKVKAESYGMRFFWPLINTYGEEENSPRLINNMIRTMLRGKSPMLSSGEQIYDFVHVSDVAYALFLIYKKGVDGVDYFIGSGKAKPLREYLDIVADITNKENQSNIALGFGKITQHIVSLPIEVFDISKLRRDTGFMPQISFNEGITRTVKWIMESEVL